MRFIFFWLTGSILITNLFIQAVDSFLDDIFSSSVDDTSGLELNPDLDDNLWSSDATDFIDSAAAGDGLIFDDYATTIASTACSPSSSNSLKRRGDGVLCSIQKPDDVKGQNHPDVEIRPLGTTKDQPLLFPVFNYEICDAQIMGISRAFAACDSGREEDRKPTIDAGVYVLEHCTPFDILAGCYFPHGIWCCTDLTPELDQDALQSLSLDVAARYNLLLTDFELIPRFQGGGCIRVDPARPNLHVDMPMA